MQLERLALAGLLAALTVGCGDPSTGNDPQPDAHSELDAAVDADVPAGDAAPALDASLAEDAGVDAGPGLPTGCITGTFTPYYGNLHAHTSNSDGDGTPSDAFDHARYQGGLDIMVVTDHLEQLYTLWGTEDSDWPDCRAAADAADTPGTFVAMCGYEYGSGFSLSGSTGHGNVFFVDYLFPMIQLDFQEFYQEIINCATCVGQFNHPGDDSGQTWDDFAYLAGADAKMNLFEFNGSGPTWDLFFMALDNGWHVSPVYNQDNHSADWGTKNDRRAGFYLTSLDRAAVNAAMVDRRTFMTRDKNAALQLLGASACWMGSVLSGVSSIVLDAQATDSDVTDTFETLAFYGPGQTLLHTEPCNAQTTCTATTTLTVAAPTYVVARAVQTDGDELVSAPLWVAP